MKEAISELEEVMIVTLGTQKKASLISSIEFVKVSELKQPLSNLIITFAGFAGRMPGLISYQTSGKSGAENSVFSKFKS